MECYRKAAGATRKKILGCIFAEKLVLDNGINKEGEKEKGRSGERNV